MDWLAVRPNSSVMRSVALLGLPDRLIVAVVPLTLTG